MTRLDQKEWGSDFTAAAKPPPRGRMGKNSNLTRIGQTKGVKQNFLTR